jgi:hypothetical protein
VFRVIDCFDEAKKIVGSCSDTLLFRQLSDAVTLIANKGDFEGWKGFIDICTTNCGTCVTLPREVETVIAVNIGGHPTLALSSLFNFHLNGPGDCRTPCGWAWQDQGNNHATYKDLATPSKLVAYLSSSADNGKGLIVHGFDDSGNRLRYSEAGEWKDGYQVPTLYGYAIPEVDAPLIARIDWIEKDETVGPIRLSTIDDSGPTSGQLLGVYEPDETIPQYRRIKLGKCCDWVRIAYRRTTPIFTSKYDRVPLKSRIAFLNAVRATKYYFDADLALAHAYEVDAARLELEAQDASEPPTFHPIQVVDCNSVRDKCDDVR